MTNFGKILVGGIGVSMILAALADEENNAEKYDDYGAKAVKAIDDYNKNLDKHLAPVKRDIQNSIKNNCHVQNAIRKSQERAKLEIEKNCTPVNKKELMSVHKEIEALKKEVAYLKEENNQYRQKIHSIRMSLY